MRGPCQQYYRPLPPLFVKAFKGFTDLLFECFTFVFGDRQNVHCFLTISRLLQSKVPSSTVTWIYPANIQYTVYYQTHFIQIYKKWSYTVCFPCCAGAVTVAVALNPLLWRSLSADIESFYSAVTLPLFVSTLFKKHTWTLPYTLIQNCELAYIHVQVVAGWCTLLLICNIDVVPIFMRII